MMLHTEDDTLSKTIHQFVEEHSSPILMFDVSRNLIEANRMARSVLGLPTTQMPLPAEQLPYGEQIGSWLSRNGAHDDWTAIGEVTYQPIVQSMEDTGCLVLTLRDVSELRKLARNQNEFIRLLSHDLRTPLTYILGFASMLEQQVPNTLSERQMHFVSKIMTGIEQITRIVENIQDAGRFDPETGFYEMSLASLDVGVLVARIIEQVVIPATKPELKINLQVDQALPLIFADTNMLERAITNLVDNAIKYTPDQGTIDVIVQRLDSSIMIQVRDDGLGIHPDDMGRLFQRHVRIRRPEFGKIKGSGLGLFIVKSVAQRHGGDAWVESKLEEGSSFFLSLPLRRS